MSDRIDALHYRTCRVNCPLPINESPEHVAVYGYPSCIEGHDDHECTCADVAEMLAEGIAEAIVEQQS